MAQMPDVQSEPQSDQAEQTVVDIAISETDASEVETKEDMAALELEPAASSEAVTPVEMEAREEAEAGAGSRPQTAEAWAEVVPEPEEVVQLRTENPALLQEVWEQKMEQVPILESAFLDNPNMMLAGEVSDQVDALEAWQPNADETRPDLQDAVDFVDILTCCQTWSAAVQSATKASLAKVAGDAALAFRREKLALREWSVSGAGDLAALQANWAEHLDAQRNIPGADGQANWTVEEGDRFFEEVKAVLEAGEATWSRKQRSGWRGDWVERQRSQWDQQLRLWEAERVELLEREAEALAQSEPVSEPMADVEEVPVEAQEESAVELIPVSDPFGEDGPETWIGFAFDGIGEELDGEEGAGLENWANDVAASDEVQRAWQRFESAVGSSAVPQVASAEDLDALSPKVAARWLDLRAAMLNAWGWDNPPEHRKQRQLGGRSEKLGWPSPNWNPMPHGRPSTGHWKRRKGCPRALWKHLRLSRKPGHWQGVGLCSLNRLSNRWRVRKPWIRLLTSGKRSKSVGAVLWSWRWRQSRPQLWKRRKRWRCPSKRPSLSSRNRLKSMKPRPPFSKRCR